MKVWEAMSLIPAVAWGLLLLFLFAREAGWQRALKGAAIFCLGMGYILVGMWCAINNV